MPNRGLKNWISHKWETAETWLPWVLGGGSGLIIIGGLLIGFLRDDQREPAAFVEISDSELPASQTYSEDSIESLSAAYRREDRAAPTTRGVSGDAPAPRPFVVNMRGAPEKSEIESRTGIRASQARAVILAPDLLQRRPGQELKLKLSLFPATQPIIILKAKSGYDVNNGIHSGVAEGDPESQVHITTADGMVSGIVRYLGREYRIVSDPARGVHYILEVEN